MNTCRPEQTTPGRMQLAADNCAVPMATAVKTAMKEETCAHNGSCASVVTVRCSARAVQSGHPRPPQCHAPCITQLSSDQSHPLPLPSKCATAVLPLSPKTNQDASAQRGMHITAQATARSLPWGPLGSHTVKTGRRASYRTHRVCTRTVHMQSHQHIRHDPAKDGPNACHKLAHKPGMASGKPMPLLGKASNAA